MSYLLASIVWALTAELPPDVERYFLAQFVATIFIDAGMKFLGTKSPVYAGIYSFFTLVIIATMLGILAGKFNSFRKATLGWMLGIIVMLICYVSLPKPLPYYKYISLLEGLTLTTCGTILIFAAKSRLYLSLAILWIFLAGFRLGYALEMGSPVWSKLNGFLPASFCIIAFTAIGAMARRPLREKGQ